MNLTQNFTNWMESGIRERGWSLRELARRSELSSAHLSNIKNGGRSVTWDVVAAVAKAFGERPEDAFRQVGLLSNHISKSTELTEIIAGLKDDQIEDVISFAEWKRQGH